MSNDATGSVTAPALQGWVVTSDVTEAVNLGAADDSPYLTVERAAVYCRCAPATIYNSRAATGQPAAVGTGRLLFTREALDRWLANAGKAKRGRPRKGAKNS